jgi:signal transduction histidine kinase
MSRPFFRWLLFGLCLAVVLGVMAWITGRVLDLEEQRRLSNEEARRQEMVRLALWRMDSLASALLIRENARPVSHYQAFYAPVDLISNSGDNVMMPKGAALQPSPLLGSPPELVLLHFELVQGMPEICSPQAPSGQGAEIANQWYALTPQIQAAAQKLAEAEALLQRHPEAKELPRITPAAFEPLAAQLTIQGFNPMPQEQIDANNREFMQRAMVVTSNASAEKTEMQKVAPRKVPFLEPSLAPVHPASPIAGDLRPVWLEGQLLLLRRATLDGRERLQGVWLDWKTLEARLLETIRDLLPAAKLTPASPNQQSLDASALVTLPVRLEPGVLASFVPVNGVRSALRPALVIAWACVVAAAVAIGFVLHRAMRLSERRGAFVSSVTHELRTPLTTFRLYSEMLAEDMVPDPEQRRGYLRTLCDESTRLMHLVENVLAYSRIERGRTAARLETVPVRTLVDGIEPRLRQCAARAGLNLIVECPPEAREVAVLADAMAVDQILSNLVDNACKYASAEGAAGKLHLSVEVRSKVVMLTVRDHGPGLTKEARRKLFQPFAKSATEAAHSAPGVGLGLALCRRLARELGGDLTPAAAPGGGAAFTLSLRRV